MTLEQRLVYENELDILVSDVAMILSKVAKIRRALKTMSNEELEEFLSTLHLDEGCEHITIL